MRTQFHGWKSPRKGLHWINVVDRLDRIWLWFCINMVHFLKRKQRLEELEHDLDTIRNLPWHNETKTNK
jgi:hypothetical protein